MSEIPTIETERLVLRPFTLDDAKEVQRLAGDWEVASTTLEIIPHPYEDGMAEQWISTHQDSFAKDINITLAITRRQDGNLIGTVDLSLTNRAESAYIGYWLGKEYWNNDYCTESVAAMIKYGFEVAKLNRIFATHLSRNPASGRVMQKVGMRHEGHMRQAVKAWGKFEDIEYYGIIRSDKLQAV